MDFSFKMSKQQTLKPFLINTLRRASYRWSARNDCLKAGRVSRGFYKCSSCGGIFQKRDIRLDHIEPVVPLSGFTTWDSYINRMYPNKDGIPDPSGFQILCRDICDKAKTDLENQIRKINRNSNKKENKKKSIAKKSKV